MEKKPYAVRTIANTSYKPGEMPPPTPPPMPLEDMVKFQAKTQAMIFNDVLISIAAESKENLNMSYDDLKKLTESRINKAIIHEQEMWAKPHRPTFHAVDKSVHEANKAVREARAEAKRQDFYGKLGGFFKDVLKAYNGKPSVASVAPKEVKYWHDDPLAQTLTAELKQKELVK